MTIQRSLKVDKWAISIDIKDAYLHVPIHKRSRIPQTRFQGQSLPISSVTIRGIDGPICVHSNYSSDGSQFSVEGNTFPPLH